MSSSPLAQVLLLEKDYTNRALFAEYLEQCGYSVFQLADEREVFETLESYRPDVLVTNLKMPAIDGLPLSNRSGAHVLWRCLPILVLTGYTLSKYQHRAYQLGANAYLTKPMAPSVLNASIAQLVDSPLNRTKITNKQLCRLAHRVSLRAAMSLRLVLLPDRFASVLLSGSN